MKIVFEIPDSMIKNESFSMEKIEKEIRSILFLRLFEEGVIPFQSLEEIISKPQTTQLPKSSNLENKHTKLQGIWKDREDMKNTTEYVQNLREKTIRREI